MIGPPYCISDASQKNNQPRHSHRQLHIHMQLAHPVASGALPKNIISPDIAICSHICIYDRPTLLHQEPFLKKTIGPDAAIGSRICICNGPTLWHRRCFPKNNWPRRSHRQPHMHIQLAHPVALGALSKNIISPDIAIGSHICIYDGPALLHQEPFLKKQSAQMQPSAAANACVMGPPYCIGNAPKNVNGPRCSYWQPHAYIQWAHPVASGALLRKIIHPNVAIGSRMCLYDGPTLLH